MASIKLDTFKMQSPQSVAYDKEPRTVDEERYVYKDIRLDLRFETDLTNSPDGTSINSGDLATLKDERELVNALKNVFSTLPGQKLLNPFFGLNLSHYCFDPVNRVTADHIARTILIETPLQDSRLNIKYLRVTGDQEAQQYSIEFTLDLPTLKAGLLNIKGILNSDGFTIEQG